MDRQETFTDSVARKGAAAERPQHLAKKEAIGAAAAPIPKEMNKPPLMGILAALFVIGISLAALLGHFIGFERLYQPEPSMVGMAPNTALALLVIGVILFLDRLDKLK